MELAFFLDSPNGERFLLLGLTGSVSRRPKQNGGLCGPLFLRRLIGAGSCHVKRRLISVLGTNIDKSNI
jgi:hypothetical protein